MALVRKDRVKETTTTTGTGALALGGAATGFQPFSVIGVGNTCEYAIEGPGGVWETGLGTLSATQTLQRTTVYESSSAGAKADLPAGAKTVFLTATSRKIEEFDTGRVAKAGDTMTGSLSFAPGAMQILTGGTTAITYATRPRWPIELRSGSNTLNVTGIPESGGDLELDVLFTAGTLAFAQTIRWKIGGGAESTVLADTGVTLTAGTRYAVILWSMGGTLYGVIG